VGVLDKLTRLEKRLESLAARPGGALEPIELRARVLDDIESRVEPVGDGRFRLPYAHVRIHLVAANARQRDALRAMFDPEAGFREAVLRRLRDARATTMDGFDVSVKVASSASSDTQAAPFRIDYQRRRATPAASQETFVGRAQLTVTKGTATRKVYLCAEPRINIGRVEEVLGADQHVVRRNHIAFVDAEDAENQTVSRSHAHIRFNAATGEFRIHDDHSSYGTRIFRDGRTIQVPAARGALLRSGDEISFGRAAVRFVVRPGRNDRRDSADDR
jgi:pSer/pThr/pTyr-binding forkhead associated (FHA) protein